MSGGGLAAVRAFVLVGGLGTRLRDVVADVPKPLAPIAGRPFLAWLLEWLRAEGVAEVVLCTGYKAALVREQFPDGSAGVRVLHSPEPEPLGTAGALRYAATAGLLTTDPVLVCNGDSFVAGDLAAFLAFHRERAAAASLLLSRVERADRFGSVDVAADGSVRAFREKEAGAGLVNAGVYLLRPDVVAGLPQGVRLSLEYDVFPGLVGRGLCAQPTAAPLLDIGTPASFAEAQTRLPVLAAAARRD